MLLLRGCVCICDTRRVGRWAAVALSVVLFVRASAQDQAALPAPVFEGADAELVVQFNDLASQLSTPAGRTLRVMADELGVFERTRGAWEGLSGALKMTPEAAINRLLGGRVLLIADGVGGADMRWACVMEVDEEIARLVPKRLNAAPRASLDGRTVYAVEDGRFRVVCDPAREDRAATIVIAQDGADAMLRTGAELGSRWARHTGRKGGGAIALMMYHSPSGTRLHGTLHSAEGGWRLAFNASPGLFGQTVSRPPVVSRAWFDAMSEDALFSFIGPVVRIDTRRGASGWFDLGPEGVIWRLLPFEPPGAFVNNSGGVASVSIDSVGKGRLDCSLGFLVTDPERAARDGDAYVCDILEAFTGSPGYGKNAPLCTGTYPEAARWQSVDLGERNAKRRAYGPRLEFVWGVRPDAGRPGAGWWTMRVLSESVPDAAATLMRQRTPIDTRGGDGASMLGRIRPAGLLSAMSVGAEQAGLAQGPIRSLRWVEEVFWRVDAPGPGGGVLSGELVLRMRPGR